MSLTKKQASINGKVKRCYACKQPASKKTVLMVWERNSYKDGSSRYICRNCNRERQAKKAAKLDKTAKK